MSTTKIKWKLSPSAQAQVKSALASLRVTPEIKQEQHCAYRLDYKSTQGWVIIKQFTNGTFYVEGTNEGLLAVIRQKVGQPPLEIVGGTPSAKPSGIEATSEATGLTYPYFGSDESGKGDYFGPLVVACVILSQEQEKVLSQGQIRDSKTITDANIPSLVTLIESQVPAIQRGVLCLMPETYNQVYETYKQQGKTLNNLLADQHSQLIAQLLSQNEGCRYGIVDQFAPQPTLIKALKSKGVEPNSCHVHQETKAERYTAVAAASILARKQFLDAMASLEAQFDLQLHKGAGAAVVHDARGVIAQYGPHHLAQVAKLHFKTTDTLMP